MSRKPRFNFQKVLVSCNFILYYPGERFSIKSFGNDRYFMCKMLTPSSSSKDVLLLGEEKDENVLFRVFTVTKGQRRSLTDLEKQTEKSVLCHAPDLKTKRM